MQGVKVEDRKQFISRMLWLVKELKESDKASEMDISKMLEFNLMLRDLSVTDASISDLHRYVYENVDGNKAKLIMQYVEVYGKRKDKKI